jgi:hypothetical protein
MIFNETGLFVFILIFFSIQVWAGGGSIAGNGGDVIYCPTPSADQKPIELLDMFESRVLKGNVISLGDTDWSDEQRIHFVIQRLKRVDRQRASVYEAHALNFLEESEFTSKELPDIPDSFHIALPKGCKIRQIVIQAKDPAPGQKRFLINQILWNQLDSQGRVALIFHEIIYREALSLGQENSIKTRAFNAALMSKSFDTLLIPAYVASLYYVTLSPYRLFLGADHWVESSDLSINLLGHPADSDRPIMATAKGVLFGKPFDGSIQVEIKNDHLVVDGFWSSKTFSWSMDGKSPDQIKEFYSVRIDDTGMVLAGRATNRLAIQTPLYQIYCDPNSRDPYLNYFKCEFAPDLVSQAEVEGQWVRIRAPRYVRWGGEDMFERIKFDKTWRRITTASFFAPTQINIHSVALTFQNEFQTYDSGAIHHGFLATPGRLQVPSSSTWVVAAAEEISLREDGSVEELTLAEDAYLKSNWDDDGITFFPAGKRVKLNEKGVADVVR